MTTARCTPCGREWTGLAEAHCNACHRHFTTDGVADRHRTGPMSARRCLDPATATDKHGARLFAPKERRTGVVWGGPSPSPQDNPWRAAETGREGGNDDPWSLPVPSVDAVAHASWLARLVALENQEHDDQCNDGEDQR